MSEQVRLEIAPLVEAPATGGALVWRLLHVKDLVDGQGAALAESLATLATLERLLLAVDVLVISEVVLASEGLPADVAGEGPLVRVRPLVDQEVVALGEVSRAVLADELLLGSCSPAGHPEQPPVEDPRQEGVVHPKSRDSQGRHGVTQGQYMTRDFAQVAARAALKLRSSRVVGARGLTIRAGDIVEASGAPGYYRVEG